MSLTHNQAVKFGAIGGHACAGTPKTGLSSAFKAARAQKAVHASWRAYYKTHPHGRIKKPKKAKTAKTRSDF